MVTAAAVQASALVVFSGPVTPVSFFLQSEDEEGRRGFRARLPPPPCSLPGSVNSWQFLC